MKIAIGILIPFLGTSIGSLMVYFMKNNINKKMEKLLLGFASGVMIAASVWSLLIPSIDMAESQGYIAWFPAALGFVIGIFSLLLIDNFATPNFEKINFNDSKKRNIVMLVLAVTLHNIPEGMAVGVAFAGSIAENIGITIASAMALSFGIAIQNFPEGAIISMPLKDCGMSKNKAFLCGVLSGIVEPVAAFLTVLLANFIIPILPYMLAFAAGAMFYVVANDLIPESQNDEISNLGIIGITIGFLIMMVLDVALG